MFKKITNDIFNIGVYDNKIDLFEGHYKVPQGVTYNSYLIKGKQNVILDTVDINFANEWLNNIKQVVGEEKIDYLILQHIEPDHSASVLKLTEVYNDVKIVTNAIALNMLKQFFPEKSFDNTIIITDGQQLKINDKEYKFIFAPMVHWPEVFFTFEQTSLTLFSADAFGRFGKDDNSFWIDEARRYYIGIVGKYGMQVQKALSKLSNLNILRICPLHGSVLEGDLTQYLNYYQLWSTYIPEKNGVTLAYTSVYGHTKQAVLQLAQKLSSYGIEVAVFDLARCDIYQAISSAFKYSNLVLATTTYNMDIFPYMREYINGLTLRNFQKRNVAIIENGSWAPNAKKVILELFKESKDLSFYNNTITIKSNLSPNNQQQIEELAISIKEQINNAI